MLTRIIQSLMRRDHRIQTYLITMVVGLMLPSLVFIGYLFIKTLTAEQTEAMSDIEDRTAGLAQVVDRQLAGNKVLVEVLAQAPSLTRGELEGFYDFAKLAAETHGDTITLAERDGTFVLSTTKPYGTPLPRRTDMSIYGQFFDQGQTFVSKATRGLIIHSTLFLVAAPFKRDGMVKYSVAMGVRAERLQPLLRGIPAGMLAGIVDGAGTILARSIEPDRFVGQPVPAEVMAGLHGADNGRLIASSLEGRPCVLAGQRVTGAAWWGLGGHPHAGG
ncbi:hypothetical protein WCLP8_3470001 [uncultured Gammaproteobacteria bacterium]